MYKVYARSICSASNSISSMGRVALASSLALLTFGVLIMVTIGCGRAGQKPSGTEPFCKPPAYPKLGAPLDGRLSQPDMLKLSAYDDQVARVEITCSAPNTSAVMRHLGLANGFQHRVMSGALLFDAGQRRLGTMKMRSGIAAMIKLVGQGAPSERRLLYAYVLEGQQLYNNPAAQSLADEP